MVDTEARRLLAAVPLFAQLPAEQLDALSKACVSRRVDRGALIVIEGQPGDALYVIAKGSVVIYRSSSDGDRVALTELRPPEAFGDLALLDARPRSASAEALETTELLSLSRGAFLAVLRQEPALVDAVLHGLGGLIRRLTDQAADSVLLDLTGRVAKSLLRLAASQVRAAQVLGQDAGGLTGHGPVTLTVTQTRLAELAGGSRQSVNAALAQLAANRLVSVAGRSITLLDPAGLQERSGRRPGPRTARVR
ncbi:MAG TPA: Crp/Fnr family transcriptional regulator [Mycobacteriales bacterium]|nr:Crp/Fnr family transcriptional regulator [Mycobacteriales bacterium]